MDRTLKRSKVRWEEIRRLNRASCGATKTAAAPLPTTGRRTRCSLHRLMTESDNATRRDATVTQRETTPQPTGVRGGFLLHTSPSYLKLETSLSSITHSKSADSLKHTQHQFNRLDQIQWHVSNWPIWSTTLQQLYCWDISHIIMIQISLYICQLL